MKGFRKLICILSMFWEREFTHWAVVTHSHYFSPFSPDLQVCDWCVECNKGGLTWFDYDVIM